MSSRTSLHEEFYNILNSKNVYYNPPESTKMNYPCIKYSLSGLDAKRANDQVYINTNRYEVILIDPDPDTPLFDKLLTHFKMCSFDRSYKSDGLNHYVFTIYY